MKKIGCILLVDDDRLSNLLTKSIIDNANCTDNVVRTLSGRAGLKYILYSAAEPDIIPFPNLIILDILMPEFSGHDFLDSYNEMKFSFPIKPVVVVLTTSTYIKDSLTSDNVTKIYNKPLTDHGFKSILDTFFSN
ncbi:MAG: response regulator [Ferruginibacter sp.]